MADGEKVADPWGTLVQHIKEREAGKAAAAAAQKEFIAQSKQRVKEELARIRAERKAKSENVMPKTRDDIDFDKDGKPSKMVPPPKESDAEIEERDLKRKAKREAEIKKGAAEYEANPRYGAEKKLKDYITRRHVAGGGSGGSAADRREAQLGADLDPKALMGREGMKKGGKVKSASARADGCAIRGKTRA